MTFGKSLKLSETFFPSIKWVFWQCQRTLYTKSTLDRCVLVQCLGKGISLLGHCQERRAAATVLSHGIEIKICKMLQIVSESHHLGALQLPRPKDNERKEAGVKKVGNLNHLYP